MNLLCDMGFRPSSAAIVNLLLLWLRFVLYDSCLWNQKCIHALLQESLKKIITTLALKNEEIQNFICCLKQSLENLEVNTTAGLFLLFFTSQLLIELFDECGNVFVSSQMAQICCKHSVWPNTFHRQCSFNSTSVVFAGEFKPSAGGSGVRV